MIELETILEEIKIDFRVRGLRKEAELIKKHSLDAQSSIDVGDLKNVISRVVRSISRSRPDGMSYSAFPTSESRLENRLNRIEGELNKLGSNPALEKKVAKLEEDLRKVRVDSIRNLEGDGQEQKNQTKKFETSETKVFVIMPFNPIFDDVWDGGIKRACNSENLGCLRVDKVELSTWISDDIKKYLEMADIVITDITGNNPNVMFELGWAIAKDKKQIVIRQKDDPNKVPFDVKDIRYISYTNSWSGIEKLCKDICSFIKSTSETLGEKPAKNGKKKLKLI